MESPFQPPPPGPQKTGLSTTAIVGIGCGVTALILVGAIIAGFMWLKSTVRHVGTDMAVSAMQDSLQELDIPADQRQRIHARIESIGGKFKSGELELDQVAQVFQKLGNSPLMSAGMSLLFKRAYVQDSGLTDQEKDAAERTIQRFARGSIDRTIPGAASEKVLEMISNTDSEGNRDFKEHLTDDELRAFLAQAASAADEAGIAPDVPAINFADEFDKVVDEALGQVAEAYSTE